MSYQEQIMKITGCTQVQACDIEDIMRNDILHSTLDWLTGDQFKKAAQEAKLLYDIFTDSDKYCVLLDAEVCPYYLDAEGRLQFNSGLEVSNDN